MPRIDPLQLINCLQVLLSSNGGILSNHEVHRLVSLMTKFSKKLVSKCVYVLILKNTDNTLLDSFMNAGGWTLIQLWLHDGMCSLNWALVKELLELLLITPVDVERLKSNNIPKLVKSLSKRDDLDGIHELSSQLVQQWLKIVKGETSSEQRHTVLPVTALDQGQLLEDPILEPTPEESTAALVAEEDDNSISTQTFYKVSLKDGKQVISKVDATDTNCDEVAENVEFIELKNETELKEEVKDKEKKDEKKKSHDRSKHKSSSSKSSSSSSSRDKDRSSSSHRDRDRDKHSKDKRDKEKRDKDKRSRSNGSVKSSSGNNSSSSNSSTKSTSKDKKETREKQAEKDKDTLAKLQPQSVHKLPKIPKKSSEEKDKSKPKKEEPKKGTMSIEIRKNNEERPKTVKVYKSKMRLTGLEEEPKPAPPRPVKKPAPSSPVIIPPIPLKRASPIRDLSIVPPEKKTKIELERPGAIKLIPPKPKPPVLQESDMFMDALAASATSKKEPKKRKRRASVSKDSSGQSPPSSPSHSNSNPAASPPMKNISPPKFYQDTLESEDPASDNPENGEETSEPNKPAEPTEEPRSTTPTPKDQEEEQHEEPVTRNNNGLKGVLVYMRRKGPKKSIKWKPDEELVDVQYFELDETERVNVTKAFIDMAKMDVQGEREALQMSRKLPNEDTMDIQTAWRFLIEIELPDSLASPGSKSLEKDIQFAREKSVLQAIYFNKKMLPDSPTEPDPENYQIKDPITIPIDDVENPEHDFRNKPWPEPKGSPPPPTIIPNNIPPMFPNPAVNFPQFPPQFQNMPQGIPPFTPGPQFMPQNTMPPGAADWNNMPPQMIPPNMGPPDMMNQGPMNPNMYMQQPPDNFNPMMTDTNHRFPPPFNQHQQGPGMFPQGNFNTNRGGFGGFRRGGSGPWVRMNGPSPGGWNNNMRGSGGGGGGPHRGGGRLCNNIRNKGFCRNRDNCPYFHPN